MSSINLSGVSPERGKWFKLEYLAVWIGGGKRGRQRMGLVNGLKWK